METPRMLRLPLVTIVAAAALALGGCTTDAAASAPEANAVKNVAVAETGIVIGDGMVDIQLWSDPACPHCMTLEEEIGQSLATMIDAGDATLTLHPLTYVSAKRGDATDYSTRAAAAMFAVANTGETAALLPLYVLIQQNQVTEAGAPTDDELIAFAADSGAVITADELTSAMTLATAANDAWLGATVPGTSQLVDHVPLLVIDGAVFEIRGDGTDDARFQDAVAQALSVS